MARIAGVDLPQNKQVWIGLTYIHGIGRARSTDILDEGRSAADVTQGARTSPRTRRSASARSSRTRAGRGRPAQGSLPEHQAPDGDRQLPRRASSPRPAGPRPAHAHQLPHPQGSAQGRGREQEEADQEVGAEGTWPSRRQQRRQPRRKRRRAPRRRRRVVPHGVAHVQATFNNTIISITDPEGNVLSWSSAGRIGFKGSRKGTPFAAQVAAQNCAGHGAATSGMRTVDVVVTWSWRRPRVGDPRHPVDGHRRQVDQGRDADPAQRLPAAQAPPSLGARGRRNRRRGGNVRASSGCAGAARRLPRV